MNGKHKDQDTEYKPYASRLWDSYTPNGRFVHYQNTSFLRLKYQLQGGYAQQASALNSALWLKRKAKNKQQRQSRRANR